MILLVDDEEMLLDITGQMLDRMGYPLKACASAEAALEEFEKRQQEIVLAVIDYSLGACTAVQLIEQIRRIKPDLPVIVYSGYVTGVEIPKIEKVYFVRKPFTFNDLREAVQSALPEGLRVN